MLHQPAQIPGSGEFLPKFLLKEITQLIHDAIFAGHSGRPEQSATVCHQPSKLVMRVRFPSPAPGCRPARGPCRFLLMLGTAN
jgi:hypothetical protein